MTRPLCGSLSQLALPALLQLISATGASGCLQLTGGAGELELEIEQGDIVIPSADRLRMAGLCLNRLDGEYRFSPTPPGERPEGATLGVSEFMILAKEACGHSQMAPLPEIDIEALVAGKVFEMTTAAGRSDIHFLASEPLENPIDDLLSDLEATAPEELLFAQICVVSGDPRPWKGVFDREWKRRGWEVHLFDNPIAPVVSGFDLLVVHHQMSMTRVGCEDDWIACVTRFVDSGVPVVWFGPMGDPMWVGRLVDAGATFLLPAPAVEAGEASHRLREALTLVIERIFRQRGSGGYESETPRAVADLVDTLIHGVDSEEILGALLQLASTKLSRGAVFSVETTAIRCRAGFGYPLVPGGGALPRGVGLFERVIRTGERLLGIDPSSGGAAQLARALGVEKISAATAVIPLWSRSEVVGLLVGDQEGRGLPDLTELSMVASRLGGAFI